MNDIGVLDWVPILAYREFFDIPRAFIIEPVQSIFLLFDCPFSERNEDYADAFSVFVLQIATLEELPLDWRSITPQGKDAIGKVAVSEIEFDSTRRKQVRLQRLAVLVSQAQHAVA